jgi:hypothetical protein
MKKRARKSQRGGNNTSTQVIATYGGIGQQHGPGGSPSGLIQPLSVGGDVASQAAPIKGGKRARKSQRGGDVATQASLIKGGKRNKKSQRKH